MGKGHCKAGRRSSWRLETPVRAYDAIAPRAETYASLNEREANRDLQGYGGALLAARSSL